MAVSPAAGPAPVLSPTLTELFDQLTADSFDVREEATQRLANYGELIRPALLDAAHHADSPELRLRAAHLLSALPWGQTTDPAEVQQVLEAYRSIEPEVRIAAVQSLGKIGSLAFDALVRLLSEEPCDDVRWVIVAQLHRFSGDAPRERLRRLDTKSDDAPMLAAAGWAWLPADPVRGLKLLGRSSDLAAAHPMEDPAELILVIRTLYARSLNAGNYESAVECMRRLILHDERPLSDVMLDLLAFHAEYGPQPGFENDVRTAATGFYSPEMMYILGRLNEHLNQPLLANAMYRAAGLTAMATQETHYRAANFLLTHRWYDLAKIESQWMLVTAGPQQKWMNAQAHVWIAYCETAQGDDASAAESMAAAVRLFSRIAGLDMGEVPRCQTDLDWYSLRAAKAKGDLAEMALHVDRLMAPTPRDAAITINPELQIDLVTSLKALHRGEAATALFNEQFYAYSRQLDADPNDPEVLNNLAWLCARCDERGEEAAAWSAKAIQLAPVNAAYLDTAAEAAARVGRWDEAVKLEAAALKLQPGDRFMISQLVRFQKAVTHKK